MNTPRTTQEEFLGTIREALGRPARLTPPPTPPAVPADLVRLTRKEEDYVALFYQRAAENGLTMVPTTAAELTAAVLTILGDIKVKTVTVALPRLPQGPAIVEAVRAKGVGIAPWKNDTTMAAHYVADASISDVHCAIADSGSMICNSDAEHGRGHSLVVPMHIAIVRRSDVLPDMIDYLATVKGKAPAALPSAQAIITGPSKTADIEGVLITGIHGPFRVYVLLVNDA
jgi:L-lactate dehydrogenase complex protein LldG